MIKRSYYKETIDIPNMDISNADKELKASTTIIQYLYNMGEVSASNYLEKRITQDASTKYSDSLNSDYARNEKIKQKELVKISSLNSGILDRLSKIEQNMIDEQDTSIKQKIKQNSSKPALQIIREENSQQEKGLSWFDMLLGALIGGGMLAFLKGFKNLGPVKFAISLMEMGWHWIKDKVIDLATSIAKSIMKPIQEVIEFLIERISKIPGLEDIKLKNPVKPKIDPLDVKETSKVKPTELNIDKSGSKVQSLDVKEPIKTTKVPDIDAGKLATNTEKAVTKDITKVSEKAVGKGLLKKIPFLGLGIAGAFAADRIADGDYVGAGGEIASGLLSIIPIIGTAGSVGVDVALLARDIKRANEAVITKLDNEGIIDKGWFGDTTVEDWNAVRQLSIDELKTLAEYEDLNKSDKDKIQGILYKKQIEGIQVPEAPEEFNDGVKIIFNDREILADTLLESNNKLQEFLINNPFTDENSVKEETEINGEKVTQIKYKDEELNAQYVEIKDQYDRDFKKYKEARNSQLRNLKDIQEIEGELLTPEQVKNYQMSGMSMSEYSASTTTSAARTDVLNKLNEQYKNVQIPSDQYSIAERIKGAEGFRANAYPDAGKMSIGYGHQIKPGEEYLLSATLTKEQADAIFAKDLQNYTNAASKMPGFSEAPKRVQEALIDMTYNMGAGWYNNWPETMKKLAAKDYIGVKNDILASNYATQVKGRALINAKIFEQAASGDTKNASTSVSTPSNHSAPSNVQSSENINKLNRDDSINQKQAQVQKVQETGTNLVNSNSSATSNSGGTVVVNNVAGSKQEESYAYSDLFGKYD